MTKKRVYLCAIICITTSFLFVSCKERKIKFAEQNSNSILDEFHYLEQTLNGQKGIYYSEEYGKPLVAVTFHPRCLSEKEIKLSFKDNSIQYGSVYQTPETVDVFKFVKDYNIEIKDSIVKSFKSFGYYELTGLKEEELLDFYRNESIVQLSSLLGTYKDPISLRQYTLAKIENDYELSVVYEDEIEDKYVKDTLVLDDLKHIRGERYYIFFKNDYISISDYIPFTIHTENNENGEDCHCGDDNSGYMVSFYSKDKL